MGVAEAQADGKFLSNLVASFFPRGKFLFWSPVQCRRGRKFLSCFVATTCGNSERNFSAAARGLPMPGFADRRFRLAGVLLAGWLA